jgi:hypothetical protein
MIETPNEKFTRLSEARTKKAEFAMRQLQQLTSHHYEYSEQEVRDIVSRLCASINAVTAAFGLKDIKDLETSDPERLPTPAPLLSAPRTFEEGELELTKKGCLHMLHIGPQVGAAIEAITDGKPEEASSLLLNLMRS